jgi:hypothetical protein
MADMKWGRHTVDLTEPCVLFLIGMRVNRWTALGQWLPVARAMGPMIAEAAADKASGFLHAETWVRWRTILVQQYWRSTDDLIRYANDANQLHRPAWTEFYRQVGIAEGATVGIFHETITITPGRFECIYGNMPAMGLGAALGTVPATGKLSSAKGRLQDVEPA